MLSQVTQERPVQNLQRMLKFRSQAHLHAPKWTDFLICGRRYVDYSAPSTDAILSLEYSGKTDVIEISRCLLAPVISKLAVNHIGDQDPYAPYLFPPALRRWNDLFKMLSGAMLNITGLPVRDGRALAADS